MINPAEALLDELARSYGAVLFFEGLVSQLATHPSSGLAQPTATGATFDELLAMYGSDTPAQSGDAAIYAPIYHASGQPTGEARAHVLVGLYQHERKHYATVAAAALSAGVAQRVIELAEQTARQVVEVLTDFAQRLGLDPADPVVREAGRASLELVAGGAS